MKKKKILLELRTYFFAGLAAVLPIFATGYVIFLLFNFTDSILGRFINTRLKENLGFYIPGLGLILLLASILFTGVLVKYLLGRRLLIWLEGYLLRIPLISQIYTSLKKIVDFLFSQQKYAFKKVVLVEYPRKGVFSIGFMTNEGLAQAKEATGLDLVNVFIPSTPGPFSGYFLLIRRSEVIFLNLTVEEALKIVVSAGVLNP